MRLAHAADAGLDVSELQAEHAAAQSLHDQWADLTRTAATVEAGVQDRIAVQGQLLESQVGQTHA